MRAFHKSVSPRVGAQWTRTTDGGNHRALRALEPAGDTAPFEASQVLREPKRLSPLRPLPFRGRGEADGRPRTESGGEGGSGHRVCPGGDRCARIRVAAVRLAPRNPGVDRGRDRGLIERHRARGAHTRGLHPLRHLRTRLHPVGDWRQLLPEPRHGTRPGTRDGWILGGARGGTGSGGGTNGPARHSTVEPRWRNGSGARRSIEADCEGQVSQLWFPREGGRGLLQQLREADLTRSHKAASGAPDRITHRERAREPLRARGTSRGPHGPRLRIGDRFPRALRLAVGGGRSHRPSGGRRSSPS